MKYYLTTPIYYVNAAPHLGTAYSTFVADLIKRFKKMEGFDPVVLTTGSDEHSRNVERAAKAANHQPAKYTDQDGGRVHQPVEASSGIDYDHFIRTSDPKHHETVRWLFERCQKNGYIYKGSYTGQYCVNDELYVNDAKPGDPCPNCGRPTETVTEENYFFKLSAFQEPPAGAVRKESGVREARSPPQRNDRLRPAGPQRSLHHAHQHQVGHSRAGGRAPRVLRLVRRADLLHERGEGDDLWPADLHLIGKDILRFHAVYWPAFLMAADLPLPKKVFAHGWILFEENKMSKSRGNVVRPAPIVEVMGVDALRYFLLREITFGQDGSFSYDALIQRYNSDLANGLGNLASRTLTMIHQYRDGVIPDSPGRGQTSPRRRAGNHRERAGGVRRFQFLAGPGDASGG